MFQAINCTKKKNVFAIIPPTSLAGRNDGKHHNHHLHVLQVIPFTLELLTITRRDNPMYMISLP